MVAAWNTVDKSQELNIEEMQQITKEYMVRVSVYLRSESCK